MNDPLIPQEINEAIARSLDASVMSSFVRANWPPPKPRPWYVRLWWRIDRYLPRVHLGRCDD